MSHLVGSDASKRQKPVRLFRTGSLKDSCPWPEAKNVCGSALAKGQECQEGGLASHYHSSSKWTHLPKGYMRGCGQNFNPFWSTTLEQNVWIVMVEMDYIYSSISVHLLNDIRGKCQVARQGPSGLEAIENGLALDPTYCFPGNTRKVNINFAPD